MGQTGTNTIPRTGAIRMVSTTVRAHTRRTLRSRPRDRVFTRSCVPRVLLSAGRPERSIVIFVFAAFALATRAACAAAALDHCAALSPPDRHRLPLRSAPRRRRRPRRCAESRRLPCRRSAGSLVGAPSPPWPLALDRRAAVVPALTAIRTRSRHDSDQKFLNGRFLAVGIPNVGMHPWLGRRYMVDMQPRRPLPLGGLRQCQRHGRQTARCVCEGGGGGP